MAIEDRVERVLKKLKLNQFYPFPFARSGFWQTLYGAYWPTLKPNRPDAYHHVILPDGDILVLAENRPKKWREGDRIMLLVHGLTGCYQSPYMQRMCRRLVKKGYLVYRLNLRFCGPGRGLARTPYHAGLSDDTRETLKWIKSVHETSPVTQLGFSLGANITLKMAGEDGSRPSGNLDSVVAVSPPIDLDASTRKMNHKDNLLFQRQFLRHVLMDYKLMLELYPDARRPKLSSDVSIRDIDDLFAPNYWGFKDRQDYYKVCSSQAYIPEVKIPALILSSIDDPVVDNTPLFTMETNPNTDVLLTQAGGHIGFLGWGTRYDEVRWSDQAIDNWIQRTLVV